MRTTPKAREGLELFIPIGNYLFVAALGNQYLGAWY